MRSVVVCARVWCRVVLRRRFPRGWCVAADVTSWGCNVELTRNTSTPAAHPLYTPPIHSCRNSSFAFTPPRPPGICRSLFTAELGLEIVGPLWRSGEWGGSDRLLGGKLDVCCSDFDPGEQEAMPSTSTVLLPGTPRRALRMPGALFVE